MTDLDKIKLCAEAMGWRLPEGRYEQYDPLHNDAQAMALVKKFGLTLYQEFEDGGETVLWFVQDADRKVVYQHRDLNRAIVECVAKMQAAK